MPTRILPPADAATLIGLSNASGLRIRITPDGRLFDFRVGDILIHQVIPTFPESAMTRIYLRLREADTGEIAGAVPLIGPPLPDADGPLHESPSLRFMAIDDRTVLWSATLGSIEAEVRLRVHEREPAWLWAARARITGADLYRFDWLFGQDLGLGTEGGVRMNEAYSSQYLDHRIERHEELGPVLFTRQNQAQNGRHPWIAHGCRTGAKAWSTDGFTFFGADHRLTGRPAALRWDCLPNRNRQYECAYPALQSRIIDPGCNGEDPVVFFAVYRHDHPEPSGVPDLEPLCAFLHAWEGCPESATPSGSAGTVARHAPRSSTLSLFETPLLHGDELCEEEWTALYPEERFHEERDEDGSLLSFFTKDGFHIVSRRKETIVERPHAHLLRTGESLWMDGDLLGTTVAMAGAFNAQVFLGNTNMARFLSVLRNPLNLLRGSGQRLFMKLPGNERWRQLGVPSLFEMGSAHARWIYVIDGEQVEVTTRVDRSEPRIDLEARVVAGPPRAFLVSHLVLMGDNEMTSPVVMRIDESRGTIECRPDPSSFLGERLPDIRFRIEIDPSLARRMGGDELLFVDGESRGSPHAVVEIYETRSFLLTLRGIEGRTDLGVSMTEGEASPDDPREVSPWKASPVSLPSLPRLIHADPSVRRTSDILPWFAHDAWIHLTAPHGIEQYGGAAWGSRDVCQGPVEWLLAARRTDAVRRILLQVFGQQYRLDHAGDEPSVEDSDGNWPQWFMFEPFQSIQSVRSHGDILYWPLMALCRYIEASGDFGILRESVPYTDPERLLSTAVAEPLSAHVDRALARHDARCLPGTSLVRYGDGDWDDTLQPSDAALRDGMASAWTVALARDAFRRYREICRRTGMDDTAIHLDRRIACMDTDFRRHLMPDGVTAGFAVTETGGFRPLLHPRDDVTGIRYRLLPMTRGILSELFTPEEARRHLDLIREWLLFPDGVRLMSDPIPYRGGVERWFRRAETAANFGREIGLMYVHAHLRYAEALAKVGDSEGLWRALQTVNPIGLRAVVPHARTRQANVYFTSSDGDFDDRYEAARRFDELRDGRVPVRGGWRLYSSGPGLYLDRVIACLLGLRDSFGDLVIDPVLPRALDGLIVEWERANWPITIRYRVGARGYGPTRVTFNGADLPIDRQDANPYRKGGIRIDASHFDALLKKDSNLLEIELP